MNVWYLYATVCKAVVNELELLLEKEGDECKGLEMCCCRQVEFMLHQGNAEYLNKLASVLLEMQNLF